MAVTRPRRNHPSRYSGYVTSSDLVLLDTCGDPAEFIVAFLNTLDVDEGTDALASAQGWADWLRQQGLEDPVRDSGQGESAERELELARRLRSDLRARAEGGPCAEVRSVGIQVALTADGAVELSASSPVGLLAAAAAKVAIERRLDRVKICPADDCRWAFYDTSRNRSRQWCSMEVCGNRAKARAHRERATSSSS
jgi:CGNR zinc finger/Putative stress-induced transcription regulator